MRCSWSASALAAKCVSTLFLGHELTAARRKLAAITPTQSKLETRASLGALGASGTRRHSHYPVSFHSYAGLRHQHSVQTAVTARPGERCKGFLFFFFMMLVMPILRIVPVIADAVLRQGAPGRGGRKLWTMEQGVIHTDIVWPALEAGSCVINCTVLPGRLHVLTQGIQDTPSPIPRLACAVVCSVRPRRAA